MKCPQLSKPEVTAARNQNSIDDRMEKKTLGETRLSRGASSVSLCVCVCVFGREYEREDSDVAPCVYGTVLSCCLPSHRRSALLLSEGVVVAQQVVQEQEVDLARLLLTTLPLPTLSVPLPANWNKVHSMKLS